MVGIWRGGFIRRFDADYLRFFLGRRVDVLGGGEWVSLQYPELVLFSPEI